MLLHRIFLRLRYAASGLPLAGVALLLAGEWRWGAGALAGGAVLYPLFDVLERRCRPAPVTRPTSGAMPDRNTNDRR